MSKNAEGWIRNRGGKAPVGDYAVIEYRMRSGQVMKTGTGGMLNWDHGNWPTDIMAYRPHKPAEQVEACSKPELQIKLPENYGEIMDRAEEGPLQWRDRITEIDATTHSLTTERAELVQKLVSEGFALIWRVVETVEDMSDWRNWKVGDVVRYEGLPDFHSKYFTIGNLYEIKVVEAGDDCKNIYNPVIFKADDSGEENGWRPELFKFHSRPSA